MNRAPAHGLRADDRPLSGCSVLVTRTREQSAALVVPLESLGAEVIAFPVIEVVEPEDISQLERAAREVSSYDWLVLTSTNGVDRFLSRLPEDGAPGQALSGVKVAAVGSATANRLREAGIEPDLVPKAFRAEGLVESLRDAGIGTGSHVLIARAQEAREVLPESLRKMGADVHVVDSYRLLPAVPDPEALERLREGSVDLVTFASGATARHFLELVAASGLDPQAVMSSLVVASVGPVTTEGIEGLGHAVDIEAPKATMESLVNSIVDYCARDRTQ